MDASIILSKLIQKENLTENESRAFLEGVIDGDIGPVQTGAILTALSINGENPDEILGLIKLMRDKMIRIPFEGALDVCGTGGDMSGSFNISTATAFVVAGAGAYVAKHGNRAASSKCGSADVLEELGVNINLTSSQAKKILEKVGMVFIFAPLFHKATKNVVLVRKELKIRTVFNFLGPFLNPASVKRQLIGVPNVEVAKKLIQVGKKLKYEHLLIATSVDGMDEISISSKTNVFELKNGKIKKFVIDPTDYGFKLSPRKEITEGNLSQNAKYIIDLLNGVKNARRDIVVLNAGVALYVSGKAKSIEQGIEKSKESINNGRAKKVLENLIEETNKYGK